MLLSLLGILAVTARANEPVANAPVAQTTVAILSRPLLKVEVRAAGKEIWEPAADHQLLSAGDSVRTGPTASVAILMDDQTQIALGEQSLVTTLAPQRRHEVRVERIEITLGTVDASLAHQPTLEVELEAKTAGGNVRASSRPETGTLVTVRAHSPDHILVRNNLGDVSVVAASGPSGAISPKQSWDLAKSGAHPVEAAPVKKSALKKAH